MHSQIDSISNASHLLPQFLPAKLKYFNGGLQNPNGLVSEKLETVNDVKHRAVDMALTFNELVGSKQKPFITPSTSITFVVAMMILIINSIYYPHRDGVVQKAKCFFHILHRYTKSNTYLMV